MVDKRHYGEDYLIERLMVRSFLSFDDAKKAYDIINSMMFDAVCKKAEQVGRTPVASVREKSAIFLQRLGRFTLGKVKGFGGEGLFVLYKPSTELDLLINPGKGLTKYQAHNEKYNKIRKEKRNETIFKTRGRIKKIDAEN